MYALVIAIHVIICLLLIGLILVQAGRGGGLVESLSQVESVFGTKTSAFLTRATSILSILFFLTCIGLAVFSLRQSRSLMRNAVPASAAAVLPAGNETTKQDLPAAAANSTMLSGSVTPIPEMPANASK